MITKAPCDLKRTNQAGYPPEATVALVLLKWSGSYALWTLWEAHWVWEVSPIGQPKPILDLVPPGVLGPSCVSKNWLSWATAGAWLVLLHWKDMAQKTHLRKILVLCGEKSEGTCLERKHSYESQPRRAMATWPQTSCYATLGQFPHAWNQDRNLNIYVQKTAVRIK